MKIVTNIHGEDLNVSRQVSITNGKWLVPEEVPIAFVYNRRNYAVMMGTPDNLTEFALGFSLTEGVVKNAAEIISLDIHLSGEGADLRFKVTDAALERLDITQRRRNLVGSASCGLCGLENVDTLFKTLPRVSDVKAELSSKAMAKAMSEFPDHQPLNQQTRSVHAAAWVNLNGNIEYVREDVGRHNSLDKLLGILALNDIKTENGFLLMSSRCSYELVEKAAHRGIKSIVSVSGPTVFALRKAKEANMSIYAGSDDGPIEIISL